MHLEVIGRHADKLALCERWSIRARPLDDILPRHDKDVVVDCTGSAAGFELATQMVRPRGTIVLKSTVAAGKPLNLAPLVIDEINVIGSRCGPFREAIRALVEKRIEAIEARWKSLAGQQNPHAESWTAFFQALRAELNRYATSADPQQRVEALSRLHGYSDSLARSRWLAAHELREDLRRELERLASADIKAWRTRREANPPPG